MQNKFIVIIFGLSLVLMSFKTNQLVYIESSNEYGGFVFNEVTSEVNLYIDRRIIADLSLQKAIKMNLAYQYVPNKKSLVKAFVKAYNISLSNFAFLHRKQLCKVIFYLESADHGNLPVIYGMEAYNLLELKELKPDITTIKKELERGGMLLIDVPEGLPIIYIDSITQQNKKNL